MGFIPNVKTVCIDFNGVLDTYTGWTKDMIDGTEYGPRPGVQEFLEQVNELGYRPVILTAIEPFAVMAWLKKYGLWHLIHDVTNIKPAAIAYIDDRAIQFNGDFQEVLGQLIGFKPYWMEGTRNSEHR